MEMRFFNKCGEECRMNPKIINSYDEGWSAMISHFNRHPNGYLMLNDRFAFALGQGDSLLWSAYYNRRANESIGDA